VGVAFAVIGALIMLNVEHFNWGDDVLVGNLLLVINCLSFSLFLVLLKPVLKDSTPTTVTAWAFFYGGLTITCVTLIGFSDQLLLLENAPWDAWAAMTFAGLLATCFGYVVSTWAVTKIPSSQVSVYICLQPLFISILATTLLGEILTVRDLFGAACILIGLGVVIYAPTTDKNYNAEGEVMESEKEEQETIPILTDPSELKAIAAKNETELMEMGKTTKVP